MKKTTSELLAIWTVRCKNGALLDIASPDGTIATWAAERGCPSAYYHLDLAACRSVTNRGGDVHFAAELPSGSFQTVTMDGTVLEPQVACDLALDAARVLADGGEFLSVPPRQWKSEQWLSHLARAFANVQVVSVSDEIPVITCHAPTVVCEVTDMRLTLTQQLDGRAYQFHSAPGIFSARAIDQGTLAMLEEIAMMTPQHKILDLGCGIGVVGIHLASMWKCDVVAVDTNARALRSTAINAKLNGVAEHIHVMPSDGFSDIEHSAFDIVATNPPYHTD
jgi:16S rRNA G1207 methylase RsmC